MFLRVWMTFGFWLLCQNLWAVNCPEWVAKAPPCPTQGKSDKTLLPETFPAVAHIVSAKAHTELNDGEDGRQFAFEFIHSLISTSGDRVPLIFMPVDKVSFDEVRKKLSALPLPEEKKKLWMDSLVHVPVSTEVWGNEHITWQQDYLKSFVDPKSGKISVRHLTDHSGTAELGTRIIDAMAKACPKLIEAGEPLGGRMIGEGPPDLPPGDDENLSPFYGGNILGLPGGLCLRGSNQDETFARKYCAKEDEVLGDVSWLNVGHVDEVFGVLSAPKMLKCPTVITYASPATALSLLDSEPDKPFFGFLTAKIPPKVLASREKFSGFQELASLVHRSQIPEAVKEGGTHAQEASRAPAQGSSKQITNAQVARAIRGDQNWRVYNELVEEKTRRDANAIAKRVEERVGCRPEVLPVPNLFYGGVPILKEGKFSLPDESARSVLPNPANAVPVEKHLLSSHPHNETFLKYLKEEYRKLGINEKQPEGRVFLDTFDYSHRGQGNLHCVTHSIRTCKGVGE